MEKIVKTLLRKLKLSSLLRKYENRLNQIKIQKSPPFQVFVEDVKCLYRTDDEYSNKWFYPRYMGRKIHEESATKLFVSKAKGSQVIVDVGANLGWFSCLACASNPNAAVYAFEMDTANYELCKSNIDLNRLSNIVLEKSAVSNLPGKIAYKSPTKKTKSGSKAAANFRIDFSGSSDLNSVQCIRLDDYFIDKQLPALVKIDVEGAEQLVLEGMKELLSSDCLKNILIEIHPEWLEEMGGSVNEVVDLLQRNQFSIYSIDHRSDKGSLQPVDVDDIKNSGRGGRMFFAQKKYVEV